MILLLIWAPALLNFTVKYFVALLLFSTTNFFSRQTDRQILSFRRVVSFALAVVNALCVTLIHLIPFSSLFCQHSEVNWFRLRVTCSPHLSERIVNDCVLKYSEFFKALYYITTQAKRFVRRFDCKTEQLKTHLADTWLSVSGVLRRTALSADWRVNEIATLV
jgi:hypothetical protein